MASRSFGRYQLLDLLGRGGMGEVFRAHDDVTDRVVAVKLLPAHLAEDPDYRQRFQREAHTAAGLNDPHVVPIHSYGEIDGRLYVDMRLIEGRDLGALLVDEGGRLSPARAVAIIDQVASALDSAHRAGLVHRDVKPSNILIAARDFAYLIDFGIARAVADTALTNTGQTVGTLAYMAPERFSGTTDARADIYSLACVLHECLTGQRPYPGDSLEQQLAGHLAAAPPAPSALSPDVPAGFDAVIARGMAKNPDERYQSAMALAENARAALTGTPLPGTPQTGTRLPGGPLPGTPRTAVGPAPQAATEHIPWPAQPLAPAKAPSSRVGSYLVAALTVLIVAYLAGVLFAGDRQADKQIDRQGGTRITLTARTPDGSPPTQEALSQARTIIAARAKGLGLSGARVVVDGANVVVTVPGNDAGQARSISQTARLYLRPVIQSVPTQPPPAAPGGPASAPGAPQTPEPPPAAPSEPPKSLAERIAAEKGWRQSTRPGVQFLALQYQSTLCNKPDILAGNDDPALPLATCSTDGKHAYLLGPSIIAGDQIQEANSAPGQQGGYVVNLQFKRAATTTWADFTAAHVGTQIAFTLDSRVMSAPVIQEAIPGGRTWISGGDPPFTESSAHQLANTLQYGSLPLSFEMSPAEPVSPSRDATRPSVMSDLLSPPTWVLAVLIGLGLGLSGVLLVWLIRSRRAARA
jgi:protein-export membrane protein SecD